MVSKYTCNFHKSEQIKEEFTIGLLTENNMIAEGDMSGTGKANFFISITNSSIIRAYIFQHKNNTISSCHGRLS